MTPVPYITGSNLGQVGIFFRPPIGGQSRPRVSAGPVTHLYRSVSLNKWHGCVVRGRSDPLMPVWLGSENTCRVGSVRPHPEGRTPVTGRLTPHTHKHLHSAVLTGPLCEELAFHARTCWIQEPCGCVRRRKSFTENRKKMKEGSRLRLTQQSEAASNGHSWQEGTVNTTTTLTATACYDKCYQVLGPQCCYARTASRWTRLQITHTAIAMHVLSFTWAKETACDLAWTKQSRSGCGCSYATTLVSNIKRTNQIKVADSWRQRGKWPFKPPAAPLKCNSTLLQAQCSLPCSSIMAFQADKKSSTGVAYAPASIRYTYMDLMIKPSELNRQAPGMAAGIPTVKKHILSVIQSFTGNKTVELVYINGPSENDKMKRSYGKVNFAGSIKDSLQHSAVIHMPQGPFPQAGFWCVCVCVCG